MDELFKEVQQDEVVTIDENADYLSTLVGDGKKFKTVHDLARGKAEADAYIERLRREKEELEKEVKTRTSLDSFKTALEELRKPAQHVETPVVTPDEAPKFDESRLEEMLEQFLQKKEIQRTRETNSQMVARVLEENFGPRASQVLNDKAREIGLPLSDLKDLAARSPQAFFRLVGAQEGERRPALNGAVPAGSVTLTQSSAPSGARGKSYYERLRRENPKLYNDQKTTVQMMNDMAALGRDKFNSI